MTTWFSASAVMPQLRAEWELSTTAAAWLTIAVQLGFVCGALVSALLNLSDLIAPRHVILGGTPPPALKADGNVVPEDRGVALGILVGAIVVGQATPHLINGLGRLDWRNGDPFGHMWELFAMYGLSSVTAPRACDWPHGQKWQRPSRPSKRRSGSSHCPGAGSRRREVGMRCGA